MNPLLQIIEEQKKEFAKLFDDEKWNLDDYTKALAVHITSIKAFIQAQVEMLEKAKVEELFVGEQQYRYEKGNIAFVHNMPIDNQINLLQETINHIGTPNTN